MASSEIQTLQFLRLLEMSQTYITINKLHLMLIFSWNIHNRFLKVPNHLVYALHWSYSVTEHPTMSDHKAPLYLFNLFIDLIMYFLWFTHTVIAFIKYSYINTHKTVSSRMLANINLSYSSINLTG